MKRHCQAVMRKQRNTRTMLRNETLAAVTRREVCNQGDAKRRASAGSYTSSAAGVTSVSGCASELWSKAQKSAKVHQDPQRFTPLPKIGVSGQTLVYRFIDTGTYN